VIPTSDRRTLSRPKSFSARRNIEDRPNLERGKDADLRPVLNAGLQDKSVRASRNRKGPFLTHCPKVGNLGPAFNNCHPKQSDESTVGVEHDDMIPLDFGAVRNQRLSTDSGVLEPYQICFLGHFHLPIYCPQPFA
jgi:hypothetical protein